jgi:uracil-DNA glycosylase family 4
MGTAAAVGLRVPGAPGGVAGLVAGIRAGIASCRLCPAMKPFHKLPAESFGTTRTGYVLVAEAPGPKGDLFRDASGTVLREALANAHDEEYKALEDLFFVTHAVRCVPRDPKTKAKTRAPKRSECGACRPYLAFELRALHPKLVLAVGGKAAEAVLGKPVVMETEHGQRRRIGDIELLTVLVPSPHNRGALKRRGFGIESYTRWLTGLFGALIDDLR